MKIAVIGSGISGLTASWLLHRDFDLTVYEAGDYAGGHTHTVDVDLPEGRYAVDTGFIVFNKVTYPNFCRILDRLGVDSQPSRMTFSVKCQKTGLEYNSHNLDTFFAQRKNLVSPSFWRMILEIFRFRSRFKHYLDVSDPGVPLVRTLRDHGFSSRFIEQFITPLGSSLWSADPEQFSQFPLQTFVRFFKNHGFLDIRNPFEWRVICGGSRQYVEKMTAGFAGRIRTNMPVTGIRRFGNRVEVTDRSWRDGFLRPGRCGRSVQPGTAAADGCHAGGKGHPGSHSLSGERYGAAYRRRHPSRTPADLGQLELSDTGANQKRAY